MGELGLEELKKEYEKYIEKYNLPDFKKVNGFFEIDKIDRKSDCFLRIVRKVIMEKVVSSLSFFEVLLNPVNAPNIYLNYIKSMSREDRKIIEKIYGVFGELSMDSLNLEVNYKEEKEAELIKKAVSDWESVSGDFSSILSCMKNPKSYVAKEKSYFG